MNKVFAFEKFMPLAVPPTTGGSGGLFTPIQLYSGMTVTKCIFREIDIIVDPVLGLQVIYTHHGSKKSAPADITANDFKKIRKWMHRFPKRKKLKKWAVSRAKETPLSINIETEVTLIVLKIPDNSNLQFNRAGSPISIVETDKDQFGSVYKVDEDGIFYRMTEIDTNLPDGPNNGKDDIDHCKYAMFVAKPLTHDYYTRFNVHVDVVGLNERGDVEHATPIVIDPDVRHPGGSDD